MEQIFTYDFAITIAKDNSESTKFKQAVGGRAAATICPRPSPPSVVAEAPRAAEPTAPADRNVVVGYHAQYVPTLTAPAA